MRLFIFEIAGAAMWVTFRKICVVIAETESETRKLAGTEDTVERLLEEVDFQGATQPRVVFTSPPLRR